jgi:ectoine hydroxylase-related dioxygenase (phytanoyl-CoA dioxygenase family)
MRTQTDIAAARITDADLEQYDADGAICLRGLFDERWVDRMRAAIADITARETSYSRFFSFSKYCIAQKEPELMAFAMESPAAEIAKRIMRSKKVQFYFDQIFVKEPGMRGPSPWHHDQPFWPVNGHQICSVWLALDPVTKATSGLEYVAGSHRWGKFFKPPAIDGVEQPGFNEDDLMPDIAANLAQYRMLNWDMAPGDCLVHHGLTVHGAGGNTSLSIRRRALATRWVGDDATYRADGGDVPLRVEGLRTGAALPPERFPIVDI